MKKPDELWDDIGSLPEEQLFHVITKLFGFYDDILKREPNSREALLFFRNLDVSISQTLQCNSNRR